MASSRRRTAADYPVLTLEGPPGARGLAYGRLAADRIRDGLEFYRGIFAASGLEGDRLERAAARLAEEIADFDPDMLVELEAVAAGAEVTLGEVVSLNARSELMRSSGEGCTGVACLPGLAGGRTLLGQNWDWHPSRAATGVLLRILPDDGPAMLTFAEAGALARCGLNEFGIGVVGNALECEGCTCPGGVPVPLLRRRILGCSTLEQAVAVVFDSRRGTSVNHLIASADGLAVACEATPRTVYRVDPENGLLGHSNHFLSARGREEVVDTGIAAHPDTLRRAPRVEELLAPRRPVDIGDMQEALSDHDGYPDSICRHAVTVEIDTWATVASVVMDLDRGRMWLAAGPPCETDYTEHQLTPIGGDTN